MMPLEFEQQILLKVTYKIQAHQIEQFLEVFETQLMPLISELDMHLLGIWKTLVGEAGEFMELWQFQTLAEFETKWTRLMEDPRLKQIFAVTGPLVQGEKLVLLGPALGRIKEDFKRYQV